MNINSFLLTFDAEENTKQAYAHHLKWIAAFLDEEGVPLKKLNLDGYAKFLSSHRWSNASRRLNLSALKAYLRWDNPNHPLLEFKIPRRQSEPGRFLRKEQRDLLISACKEHCHSWTAIRNRAIIRVLFDTLVRSSELCRIQLYHLDLSTRVLKVDTKAHNGRGRDWETKTFSPRTAQAIEDWLQVREHYSLEGDPYLFVSMTGTALTPGGLKCVFKKLRKHVGFEVSPHDFRRGGASYAVERGVPDRLVMQQGGWRTHSVFQRYTEGAKLTAYADLMWPD